VRTATEGEGRIADRVELQKAIDSVPRRQTVVWPAGPFLTSVAQVEALPPFGVYRPPPPKRPAKPCTSVQTEPVSADVVATDPSPITAVVSRPAEALVAAPDAVDKSIVSRSATLSRRRRRRRLRVTLRIRLKW
jgi:hypothetical protein